MKFSVEELREQKWERGRRLYWFVNDKGESVWRYWTGSAEDIHRREEKNYFMSERMSRGEVDYHEELEEDPFEG
jgi:hypothetical protein